jgi:hypothetical protein
MEKEYLYYLIVLVVLCFIIMFSIIIIAISSNNDFLKINSDGTTYLTKNYPGIYSGIIIMIFSFSCLLLLLVGNISIEEYGTIIFWIIGSLFLIAGTVLIIGFIKKKKVEKFQNNKSGLPSGICKKDGILGIMRNGSCIILDDKLEMCKENAISEYKEKEIDKKKRENLNKKCEKFTHNSSKKNLSRGDIDGNIINKTKHANKELGICEFINENGKKEFGYMHPYFGRKCMRAQKLSDLLNKYPKQKHIHNVKGNIYYRPYQSTQCYGYPKNDIISYDLQCKENFGNDYGLKNIDNTNCPENDYRGICEKNYQAGTALEPNSTKCVPVGSSMNIVCQHKNIRENKSNYMKMGYKSIKFTGCPEGFQRAVCDGNYHDGIQLFEKTTDCFPEAHNPDRICKKEFGILSFSEKIIADNCKPGYIRAKCNNT